MNWTEDLPTKPGYYWVDIKLEEEDHNYILVEVAECDECLGLRKVLNFGIEGWQAVDSYYFVGWYGPLERPE